MPGQAIIIIFLGLIVAKLYPDWWVSVLWCFGFSAAFLIMRHTLRNTASWLHSFPFRESIKALPGYLGGLAFFLVVLFSSVAIPLKLATVAGFSFQVGFAISAISLLVSLVFIWRR